MNVFLEACLGKSCVMVMYNRNNQCMLTRIFFLALFCGGVKLNGALLIMKGNPVIGILACFSQNL